MVVSDLDRLAQSVRRALDRIDELEADKRRLEADHSVLKAQLASGSTSSRLPKGAVEELDNVGNGVAEARTRVLKLIDLLKNLEKEL